MSGTQGVGTTGGLNKLQVVFEFGSSSTLVTGDRVVGMPSVVIGPASGGEASIVIKPIAGETDPAALQQAVNRRAAELATVAQALGVASADLAAAVKRLG